MAVPVVRQMNYWSIITQLAILGGLWWIWETTTGEHALICACVSYLVLQQMIRRWLTPYQIKGMRLVKWGEYQAAIDSFEKSYASFARYPWLDKYRSILLLSSSKMSYREMALCNLGFCYGMIGDGAKAKAYYQQALEEFPCCMVAETTLRFLNSLSEQSE